MKRLTVFLAAVTLGMAATAQTPESLNQSESKINKNEMETKTLTARQLSLAECACLEAQGDMKRLESAIRKALDNGVTVNELKEAFSHLYAYTGFPRSLNALNRLKTVLDNRKSQGIADNEGRPWTRPAMWDNAEEALKHWHGAQRDSWFQHYATHVRTSGEESNEWLEPVDDAAYDSLSQQ